MGQHAADVLEVGALSLGHYQSQLLTHLAEHGRLVAEHKSMDAIEFDPRLTAVAADSEAHQAKLAQQAIFETRLTVLEQKQSVLKGETRKPKTSSTQQAEEAPQASLGE